MRIAAVLNVSAAETIAADSGLIMLRLLMKEFLDQGHECHILAPPHLLPHHLQDDRITIHHVGMGLTKYHVRLSIPWEEFETALSNINPTAILNNQIEIAAALRAICTTYLRSVPRIISYCHYIPAILGPRGELTSDPSQNDGDLCSSLYHHIISGVLASDRVFVQSDYAKRLLETVALRVGENISPLVDVAPPPVDPDFLLPPDDRADQTSDVVLYNHRLYAHYGTDQVLKLIPRLCEAVRCEVHIADPMYLRSRKRAYADSSPQRFRDRLQEMPNVRLLDGGDDRSLYYQWIRNASFALAAPRPNAVWSMSVLDCLGMGTPVLAPRYASYPELVPEALLYDNDEMAIAIAHRLKHDADFYAAVRKQSINRALQLTPSKTAALILRHL